MGGPAAAAGGDRPATYSSNVAGVRRRRLWREVRVALAIAIILSFGLRLLRNRVNPEWAGWPVVRYAVGVVLVVGLVSYALLAWRRRRDRPRRG